MKNFLKRWKRRIILALAIVGPGLITAFADNDAAGVATYSVAAATYGYAIIIVLIPVTILLAVTQEIGARIAIVAEKGFADLIRERYGVRIALCMYVLLFIVNLAVVVQDVSGIKSALILFGLNPIIFLPALIIGLYLFVVMARYNAIERFLFALIAFYATYIASALLSKPDWQLAATSLIAPPATFTPAFLYTAIAVVGTTVTAWGQFFINSYVKDKRLTSEHLKYNRLEVYLGAILTNVLCFFILVAVAATLYANRIFVSDAAQASLAIRPFAGDFAGVLFGVGLLGAGLLGCVVVALSTAYAFSEFFGYSGSLDEEFRKSRLFYTTLLIQLAVATAIVMLPQVSLFAITLVANFTNGAILPIIFYFLYQFANNERIMGEHKNTRVQNFILAGSAVCIIGGAFFGLTGSLLGW